MVRFRIFARRTPALALAATLFAAALGPPTVPAVTASETPTARLQVLVTKIAVKNDHDWHSEGDMTLFVDLRRCPARTGSCAPVEQKLLARSRINFDASSGQTVTLDRLFPANDELIGSDESYAVVAGERYVLYMWMIDRDSPAFGIGVHDQLGRVVKELTSESSWHRGSYTEQSIGYHQGDFEITYAILAAPVPDLRPVGIKIYDLPASTKKRVCTTVKNIGITDAGPFALALRIDGVVPPGGSTSAGGLATSDSVELCVEVALPGSGQYQLSAVVDEADGVLEFDETNNVYTQPFAALSVGWYGGPPTAPGPGTADPSLEAGPAPSPVPGPGAPTSEQKPGAAQADLTVSAIRVRGQVPDGKDDCKDGKSTVTVVVKNRGPADAGDFKVGLVVDDAQGAALRQSVDDGLAAGEEVAVTFGGVRLKKGPHSLVATADATTGIAELNEGNNTLKVTARCSDNE